VINRSAAVAAPASISTGAGTDVSSMGAKTLFLLSAGTATYQAQISPDGTNWQNEGTALTASGNLFIEKPCAQVRWNCTAYTNGTPTSVVMGVVNPVQNW
jgi:hypothetical protein